MTSFMNIAGLTEVVDSDYRYKMPRIQGKVEGRGNGIKTAVVNMRNVAISLHREPGEVTKFFGCELGAQTSWNEETERSIVNGSHTEAALQSLLAKYIELFVLCPSCHLPESTYKIKGGVIYHKCFACGARDGIDMQHKLTTFILNTAKKAQKDKAKAKDGKDAKKKDKDGKDKDKKEKKKKTPKNSNGEGGHHSRSHTHSSSSKHSSKYSMTTSTGSSDDDEDEIAATLDNLEVDDTGALDNCVSSIRRFIEDGATVETLVEEARTMQTFSALPASYRFHIYILGMCEEADSINATMVNSMAPVLAALGSSTEDQRHVVGGLELLCTVRAPSLKPQFPVLLKLLYDADFMDEETILAWASAGYIEEYSCPGVDSDKVDDLISITGPFITWLKEADEESDCE